MRSNVRYFICGLVLSILSFLCLLKVEAGRPENLKNLHIPPAMKEKVDKADQIHSVKKFVESAKNFGFFDHTDKTFAPYLAEHKRFFALFYAPFSDECTDFYDGYKAAALELLEQGFLVNFTV